MSAPFEPNGMIERPDGSMIAYDKLDGHKQLEHDFVMRWCEIAIEKSAELAELKRDAISEMIAAKVMLFDEYEVKRGGADGNLTFRSVCGRFAVKMSVSKHVTFGSELEAAKALIFEFMGDELDKGGSEAIHQIVAGVFKLNGRGRIDTNGILSLREYRFDDPRWERAMEAIEAAICKDSATTYINFYRCNPNAAVAAEKEKRILLDLAKV